VLRATSVTINGESHRSTRGDLGRALAEGRGVGGREAARVGIGAAAGRSSARSSGEDRRRGRRVTGAAAGAAVAVETAPRDVVIPVGARIKLALRSAFTA